MAKKGSPREKGKGKGGSAREVNGPAATGSGDWGDLDRDLIALGEATAVDEGSAPLPVTASGGDGDHDGSEEAEAARRRRTSVVNGTHVTVAFPFSRITNPEPSEELHALAALVADLVDALAEAGVDGVGGLQDRATELRERMAGLR